MKNFMRMADVVRSKGIQTPYFSTETYQLELGPYEYLEEFWSLYKKSECFVFKQNCHDGIPTINLPHRSLNEIQPIDQNRHFEPVDLPFSVFSMESLTGYLAIIKRDLSDDYFVKLKCCLIYEKSPNFVCSFSLNEDSNGKEFVSVSAAPAEFINAFLDMIKTGQMGNEPVKQKIKIGSGVGKSFHIINRVIHIRPKNQPSTDDDRGLFRDIDWSHRWTVRGHWRSVAGLGKDRDGNYCVENFTWVTNHIKGPEDAPFVNKIRLVEN